MLFDSSSFQHEPIEERDLPEIRKAIMGELFEYLTIIIVLTLLTIGMGFLTYQRRDPYVMFPIFLVVLVVTGLNVRYAMKDYFNAQATLKLDIQAGIKLVWEGPLERKEALGSRAGSLYFIEVEEERFQVSKELYDRAELKKEFRIEILPHSHRLFRLEKVADLRRHR